MSVVSYLFLLFLFLVIVVYYIVPKKIQWVVLLIASLIFYTYAGIEYLVVVVGTAVVVYCISLIMQRNLDEQDQQLQNVDRKEARKIKNEKKAQRKKQLVFALAIIIAVLIFYKGTGFIIHNMSRLFVLFHKNKLPEWKIAAPLGISFYSFMMISYLVDLYHGKISAQKSFLKYLTYALYFPHVTQGPIARYDNVAPQMFKVHSFDYDVVLKGSWLMLWGFFKKLVIADRVALFVNEIVKHSGNYSGSIFLFMGVMYSIQIYCDFSGCMDIVRGASECLGITLAENFKRPYFSQTLPEFWRRWHASLGAFFREYVFYPVSTSETLLKVNNKARNRFGNEVGRNISSCIPILCVWVLTGVWHGANWNYIGWGVYHGILICMSTIFEQPMSNLTKKLHLPVDCFGWKVFRMCRTFFLCLIGRLIFIGKGFTTSLRMIASSFLHFTTVYDITKIKLEEKGWLIVLLACLVLLAVSIAQEIMEQKGSEQTIRDWLAKRSLPVRWVVLIGGIMIVLLYGKYGSGAGANFIYEQF